MDQQKVIFNFNVSMLFGQNTICQTSSCPYVIDQNKNLNFSHARLYECQILPMNRFVHDRRNSLIISNEK